MPSRTAAHNLSFTFLSQQILTSALHRSIRVTRTLIALTVTALTAVLVNKDSLEMEKLVKVTLMQFKL